MIQRQRVSISTSIEGEQLGANEPPTMIAEMDFEIMDVDAVADQITCGFRVSDTSLADDGTVNELQREAVRLMWDAFRLEGTMTFDSRGRVIDSEMRIPDDLPPEMRQLLDSFEQNLESFVAPLPEEPVGIRSTWEVVSTSVLNGLPTNSRALFTVDKFEGDRAYMRGMVDVTSPETVLPSPDPGVVIRLVESEGTGEARMLLDLSSPITAVAESKIRVKQLIEVTSDFGAERVQQDINISLRITPAEDSSPDAPRGSER